MTRRLLTFACILASICTNAFSQDSTLYKMNFGFWSSLVKIEGMDFQFVDTLRITRGDTVKLRNGVYKMVFTNPDVKDIRVVTEVGPPRGSSQITLGSSQWADFTSGSSYYGLLHDVNIVVNTDESSQVFVNDRLVSTGATALKVSPRSKTVITTKNRIGKITKRVKLDEFSTFQYVDMSVNPTMNGALFNTFLPGYEDIRTHRFVTGVAKIGIFGVLGFSALRYKNEYDNLIALHEFEYGRYLSSFDESEIPRLWERSEKYRKQANTELHKSYIFGSAFIAGYVLNGILSWRKYRLNPRSETPISIEFLPRVVNTTNGASVGGGLRGSF